MKKKNLKLYIIQKQVFAENVIDAIKKEPKVSVADCWIDSEWKKGNQKIEDAIGFEVKEGDNRA